MKLIRSMARRLAQLVLRVDAHGLEALARYPDALVLANHSSFLDGPLLAIVSPVPLTFGITSEFAEHRIWSRALDFVSWLGFGSYVSIDSSRPLGLRALSRKLRGGHAVALFPEGGISPDGLLQPLQPGAGRLASSCRGPIVLVRIDGGATSVFGRASAARRAILPRMAIRYAGAIERSQWHTQEDLLDLIRKGLDVPSPAESEASFAPATIA